MKKTKKGFTLVELVIVVAVMAVLVAVAIPTVGAITKKAQDSADATNAQTIESMIKLHQAELSSAGTTDGVTALSKDNMEDALEQAKLGIKDGYFLYDDETGDCTVSTASATPSGTTQFKIVYDDGIATVTQGTGTP